MTDPLYDSRNPNHGRTGGLRDQEARSSAGSVELKPCPFCKRRLEHDAAISATFHPKIPYEEYCPLKGFMFASDRLDIIEAWNTRDDAQPAQLREHSKTAWGIASRYSSLLASETRDLAAAIDEALQAHSSADNDLAERLLAEAESWLPETDLHKLLTEAGKRLRDVPQAAREPTVWLIEWPESDTVPVRWWNPAHGWMRDANAALHFARKTDADCYLSTMKIGESLKVTEHKFVSCPLSRPEHS